MMEYWDLYDKERNKLNKVVKRGDYLQDDEYHLVVNAWIRNLNNEFLITQRSANKSYAFKWECTGGSALKGESSLEAAIREVKEELGIDVSKCPNKLIGSTLRHYDGCPDILDVWLFECDVTLDKVITQEEEVNDVMWASQSKVRELYNEEKFEANAYFDEAIRNLQDAVYYIGFNANNAICNDNFFAGSITLYPTKEKGNIYYSNKLLKDTKSAEFMQKYHDFVYKKAQDIKQNNLNSYFICFNEKIRKLCADMQDINIVKSNATKILDELNNKFITRDLAKKYVPILNYLKLKNKIDYPEICQKLGVDKFVLQGDTGAGGDSTYLVIKESDMPILDEEKEYCVSKYIKNTPLNITLIIYDDDILLLPISAQLIYITDKKFKYVGGDFVYPQTLDNKIKKQIKESSLKIAQEIQSLNYRGILGIDYLLCNNTLYFMEINPRFQASSFLISLILREKYQIDIAKLHYEALTGGKMPNIELEKIDYSFVNCSTEEEFKELNDYQVLDKGYFKDNKSSVYRKIFTRSIINEDEFEKEMTNN